MYLDIDKCETEPIQPFSIWTCEWSQSRETKFCLKTCDENFRLGNGFTNITCHVHSGWIKQKIAKCIPDAAAQRNELGRKRKKNSKVLTSSKMLEETRNNIGDGESYWIKCQ